MGSKIVQVESVREALGKLGTANTVVSVVVIVYNVGRIAESFDKGYVEFRVGEKTVTLPLSDAGGKEIIASEIAQTAKDIVLISATLRYARSSPWLFLGLAALDLLVGDDTVDIFVKGLMTPYNPDYRQSHTPGVRDNTRVAPKYIDR